MPNKNETLPINLKTLIATLTINQALPLGKISDIPFIALKMATDDHAILENSANTCEIKASVFNIDYHDQIIAIAFAQLRLNHDDQHIYTLIYDLKESKQFSDCEALLAMQRYGLFIANEDEHDFLVFDAIFDADFKPSDTLHKANKEATDYAAEDFKAVALAMTATMPSERQLWDHFMMIAPLEKGWYCRMRMAF